MVYELSRQGIVLRVRLTPNSSSCIIKGIFENSEGQKFLKVNVVSVPEKGKANKELLELLAKKLHLAKQNLQLISGETDRFKKILILSDETAVVIRLEQLAKEGIDE